MLSGNLKYRLHREDSGRPVDDYFTFIVQTKDQKSAEQRFDIHYFPGDSNVDINLETLEVEEGGKRAITRRHLSITTTSSSASFVYNVTRAPSHGRVDVLASNRVDVARRNASFFTSEEVEQERILYTHDDSESRRDSFHFFATQADNTGNGGDFIHYLAVFHIHVVLRNDETPTIVVDKIFEVVSYNILA